MLRFLAPNGLLPVRLLPACVLLLAGCAGPAAAPAPVSHAAPRADGAASRGTILAVHAVPLHDPGPLRAVLRQLDRGAPASGTPASGQQEFVVRTDSGTVLAVVQPAAATLLPGTRVAILRGTPALIRTLPATVAAR